MVQKGSAEIQNFGQRRSLAEKDMTWKLTRRELKTARGFLRRAQMLVVHVSFLFFNAGEAGTAARLNDITARLTDEIEGIERLIEAK